MKNIKQFYVDFISKPLRSSIPFILLVLGVIAYIISFFLEVGNLQKIVFDFAELMIVAFFVSLVTNTYMFINIFRSNMEEIVTNYGFLSNRKDIFDIWKRASKVLFTSKFPEITDLLLSTVNASYFPNEDAKYYSDYTYSVTLEWEDKDKNHINVVQELSYQLNCPSKDKVTLSSKSWTKIDPHRSETKIISYSECKVNNLEACVVSSNEYVDPETEDLIQEQIIELSGEISYSIKKQITKKMDLDLDPYLGFRPQFILHNLRVQVFKPEDLCVTFVPRGTISEYQKIKKNQKYLEYKYNGLILPKQGFILILKRKDLILE